MMRLLLILCFGSALFFSCKKDSKSTDPIVPQSTNTATNYYGLLTSKHLGVLSGGTVTSTNGFNNAYFSSSPLINDGVISGTQLDAGQVSLNGVTFKKNNSSYLYYTDSLNSQFPTAHNWMVTGAGSVPSFSFTNTSPYPIYSGSSTLLDTIKLGQNNTISLTGITGADQINVYLSDYPQNNHSTIKKTAGNASSISFTASELNTLTSTTTGFLTVICLKDTFQTFGGFTYKFQTGYQLQKLNMVFN